MISDLEELYEVDEIKELYAIIRESIDREPVYQTFEELRNKEILVNFESKKDYNMAEVVANFGSYKGYVLEEFIDDGATPNMRSIKIRYKTPDPYITGFHFVTFEISDSKSIPNIEYINSLLASVTICVTINPADKVISLELLELENTPIYNILNNWQDSSIDIYYMTSQPNGKTVEFACKFTNLELTNINAIKANFSSDLSHIDKLTHIASFQAKDYIENDEIKQKCSKYLNYIYDSCNFERKWPI